ncbi:unnamed protein product [Calicophoron daubneyi]|uniref:Uncharacterized protein n=1 Tax=Calicophoron daubneyi TaxID=300641 RepID=A0AAV2TFB7_CALDB
MVTRRLPSALGTTARAHADQSSESAASKESKRIRDPAVLLRIVRCKLEPLDIENAMYTRFMRKLGITGNLNSRTGMNPRIVANRSRSIVEKRLVDGKKEFVKTLRAEQKCHIARGELEEMKKDLVDLTEYFGATYEDYMALLEETKILTKEIESTRYLLDKKMSPLLREEYIQTGAYNAFVAFHRQYLQHLDTSLCTMQVQNVEFRSLCKKLMRSVNDRKSIGVVNPISFMELQLLCEGGLAEVQKLTKQCSRRKMFLRKCQRNLTTAQDQLDVVLRDQTRFEGEIKQRTNRNISVIAEICRTNHQVLPIRKDNKRIRLTKATHLVPGVEDHVNTILRDKALSVELAVAQRKLHLSKLAFDQHRKLWNRAQRMMH